MVVRRAMLTVALLCCCCWITQSNGTPVDREILAQFQPAMNERRLNQIANILTRLRRGDDPLMRDEVIDEDTDSQIRSSNFGELNDGQEQSAIDRYLFEGDILLSVDQATALMESMTPRNNRFRKRSAIISLGNAWWPAEPIRYTFHESLSEGQIDAIIKAVNFWQESTCVRFQQLKQPAGTVAGDVVVFFKGDGCYSMVGRAGGTQGISIGTLCTKPGLISHELGHLLGLWHEQTRADSECCVRIIDANIQKGYQVNFRKRPWHETQTFGLPYDYGSVMHYRSTAFSKDSQIFTVQTLEPGYQRTIGQRNAPSFIDIKTINRAYCNNRCPTPLSCQYGGYTHPSTCDKCICPDGLGGLHCEHAADAQNAACGGSIEIQDDWVEITSPNYPRAYGMFQKCSWLLKTQPGNRVMLQFFDEFDISCNAITCVDYVEIKTDSSDFSKTGMRFCCTDLPMSVVYSSGHEMLVLFNSDNHSGLGFKARAKMHAG